MVFMIPSSSLFSLPEVILNVFIICSMPFAVVVVICLFCGFVLVWFGFGSHFHNTYEFTGHLLILLMLSTCSLFLLLLLSLKVSLPCS